MENSLRKTDTPEIPLKSKSLDIRSLHVEKSRVSQERNKHKDVKRKRKSVVEIKELSSGENENLKQRKKKKKNRKEVSLNSFELVSDRNVEGLNAVDELKINGGKEKDGQILGGKNSKNVSSLNNFSAEVDDNVIPIPKKPRGSSRRKKSHKSHLSEDAAGTSEIVTVDPLVVELAGDSVIPLVSSGSKQIIDDLKKKSTSKAVSAWHLKAENGACNGDSRKKRVRKNRLKGQESEQLERGISKEFEPLVDKSCNTRENLQDDDEDNLEQNAARMLSSRFDPSCTGFSGDRTEKGNSFTPPSFSGVVSPWTNCSGGSECSADAAGRVLRPRKEYKERGHKRKRRHFYELFSRDFDAYWVLNRRIKVFWPLDQCWYFGLVIAYEPERKLHHIKYDDRDEEWIDLQNERFKLLLLPSEVPRNSPISSIGVEDRHVDEEAHRDADAEDCVGNFMDSEPIIAWLARSTHRIKSSPLGLVKRRKTSVPRNHVSPRISDDYDDSDAPRGCSVATPSGTDANHLSGVTVPCKRQTDKDMTLKPLMGPTTSWRDRKVSFVYSRRRFNNKRQGFGCIFKDSDAGSDSSLATFLDKVCVLEEPDSALWGYGQHQDGGFWTGENLRTLRFSVPLMDLDKVTFNLRISVRRAYSDMFGAATFCPYEPLFLLHHGTVTAVWPKVRLEILFVDNVVGLRFMLFEGCMMQAVSLVCSVLAIFSQPDQREKFGDHLQLPITSIRFKISGVPLGRHIVFVSYNFFELKNSKWRHLDKTLNRYCSVSKQLPLDQCTLDNISLIKSTSNQLPNHSASMVPATTKGQWRKPKQNIIHMGFSKEFANINRGRSFSNIGKKHRKFPPFVLSFAAAPSFFVRLHLKLLMEKNVASVNFQKCHPMILVDDTENGGRFLGNDFSPVEELAGQVKSKLEIDALSISSTSSRIRASKNCLSGGHIVSKISVHDQDSGNNKNAGNAILESHSSDHSGSEKCPVESCPSVSDDHSSMEKSDGGNFSQYNGIRVQIPQDNQFETQSLDRGRQSMQQSLSNLPWHMSDGKTHRPNPTAPRSTWYRNRHNSGSSSFGSWSRMLSNGREDTVHNSLVNGSKKPLPHFSNFLPIGGHEFNSKPRTHHRKGRPDRGVLNENEKMVPNGSRSSRRQLEFLSCDGNVLITEGDRGWRECGAQVVLEFVDNKDWKLLVKFSGITKYSHKPHQFLQPGSTNRHTLAMMWRGEKDWILEFPDRVQWARFKEIYEECYNRNIRAASAKTIPIPGVRLIEESDGVAANIPFLRNPSKYYRQTETDVEMALNPSRVLYDMDSDDDEWLSRYQSSANITIDNTGEISMEMFERAMYMFEGVAYVKQCEDFILGEIEEIMVELGPIDIIKAMHEHWLQKRRRKRRPLIRHLQPPAWGRYQQQLKEWELAKNKIASLSNGGTENAVEKPAMFAFCLKPRGLQLLNRGLKNRSHRKLSASGHNYSFPRDHDGYHNIGRRSNGFEERGIVFGQNLDSSGPQWFQTSTRVLSPRDAVGSGYVSMSSDESERNQLQNYHRNKARKLSSYLSPIDSQILARSYNQRTGRRNGFSSCNPSSSECHNQKHHIQPEGYQRFRAEQLDESDLDEFRLRDASGAAKHASNMAKLKREKAERLFYRADLAIHKATVALMISEAMKASSEKESTNDE